MNQYAAQRRLVLKSSNAPRPYLYVFRRIQSISIARLSLNVPAAFVDDSDPTVPSRHHGNPPCSMPWAALVPMQHYNPKTGRCSVRYITRFQGRGEPRAARVGSVCNHVALMAQPAEIMAGTGLGGRYELPASASLPYKVLEI